MNRLLEIGFQPAGHWLLEQDEIVLNLTRHSTQRNILYAFVCDGQVKYVGKTIQPLARRMAGYKNPGSGQSTNIKNNQRIRDLLLAGGAVEILALPDNGLMHYGQFHLNMAAALEDDIIRVIAPEWNGGVPEKVDATVVPSETVAISKPVATTFSFVLQPTYYRTGFFNVGVSAGKFIGVDAETIEIYLGGSDQPVLGSINRRANQNSTPRIMGGVGLRDWFVNNAAVGARIDVEVLSPNAIRLWSNEG